MNEITIAVKYDNDNPTVSGRELHDVLGVQTAYKDWFPRMCGYGFVEGRDFNPLKIERVQNEGFRSVSREVTDHQLSGRHIRVLKADVIEFLIAHKNDG